MQKNKETLTNFTQDITNLDRLTDVEARRWVTEKRKTGIFSSLRKMSASFFRVYFTEKARKEGVPGLFRAVNAGMFEFLTYAKYWEITRSQKGDHEKRPAI